MKTINLDDWVISGAGARGTSYFHKDDPNLMLKFDDLLTDALSMETELEAARAAYRNGVKTPKPGDVVTDGKRFGVTFRRIPNKVSYARALAQHPERLQEIAQSYVREVKILHSTEVDTSTARNIKDVYGDAIRHNTLRPKEELERALELLKTLKDGNTCIHGDLHYGNIVFGDGGSWFIDMGNFSYGCPLFDIAMLMATTLLADDNKELFKDFYHCEPDIAPKFWNLFIKGYFGEDADICVIEKMLEPYLAIRALTMEAETGRSLKDTSLEKYLAILH